MVVSGSQEPGGAVILKKLSVPHVAGEHVHALVARQIFHAENRRARRAAEVNTPLRKLCPP